MMDEVTLLVAVLLVQLVQRAMLIHGVQYVSCVLDHFGVVSVSFGVHNARHLCHAALLKEQFGIGVVRANDLVQGGENRGERLVGMTASAGVLLGGIGQDGDEFFDRPATEHVAVLRIDGEIAQGDGRCVHHGIALVHAKEIDELGQTTCLANFSTQVHRWLPIAGR